MATTEMVHVRIDKRTKARAAKALAAMGLSVSDAVRVLLTRVAAEKSLPFEVKTPNAATAAANARGTPWWTAFVPQCPRIEGRLECGGLREPTPSAVTLSAKSAGNIAANWMRWWWSSFPC
ncbi:MAG TPA: type II toxin-antitoxin system RelB/DinJ family antitoxin [Terriglobales bacterium]